MSKQASGGEFRTHDLYFAAYLQVAGVQMLRADRNGSGKVAFVFDTSICNLEELQTAWFNQTGKVAALPYSHAVKSLKSICHMT
jgi:hypothetical protein